MKYFYDTEFLDDGNTIDLISIGIVAEDGREYYAVNSDFEQDRLKSNKWMVENVVAHLPLHSAPSKLGNGYDYHWSIDTTSALVKPKWVIANEVRDFLLEGPNDPELWAYFGAYDHVVLAQLWGPMMRLPKGIPMWTHDLMQALELVDVEKPAKPVDAHNALADARWNRDLHAAIMEQGYP